MKLLSDCRSGVVNNEERDAEMKQFYLDASKVTFNIGLYYEQASRILLVKTPHNLD